MLVSSSGPKIQCSLPSRPIRHPPALGTSRSPTRLHRASARTMHHLWPYILASIFLASHVFLSLPTLPTPNPERPNCSGPGMALPTRRQAINEVAEMTKRTGCSACCYPKKNRAHGLAPTGGDGSFRHAMPVLKASRRASSGLPTSIALPGLGVGGLILSKSSWNAHRPPRPHPPLLLMIILPQFS